MIINRKINVVGMLLKIFIVVALLFPYVTIEGKRNHMFILTAFISFLFISISIFRKNRNCEHNNFILIYGILIIIYNVIFLFYNVYYHNYYIEQINKSISFLFLIILVKKIDYKFLNENNIIKFLFIIINISVGLSIVYFFFNGDGVIIQNQTILLTKQGYFADSRLTWIFGHKSSYGLFLILFLALFIKYKDIFKYKLNYYLSMILSIVALMLSGSSTSLALSLITILLCYIYQYNSKINPIILIIVIPIVCILIYIVTVAIYNYISINRDISTLGNRTYIYEAAKYYISLFPNGIGKEFGDMWMNSGVMTIENLHNIFFNEMLRFSVKVGVIYFIIFIYICIYNIFKCGLFAIGVWITCFTLFFMDYSLRTDLLPIFIFIIYMLFFVKNRNVIKDFNKK